MKPHYLSPEPEAIFIGSSTLPNATYDFWVYPLNAKRKEVYAFAVSGNPEGGNFATITLPYSDNEEEPQRHHMGQSVLWHAGSEGKESLSLFVPGCFSYSPALHGAVFQWLWDQLYPEARGCRWGGIKLHSTNEATKDERWRVLRELRKAGLPLTDAQVEVILPFSSM